MVPALKNCQSKQITWAKAREKGEVIIVRLSRETV